MMEIPKEEILESLRQGYIEYRDCLANGNDKEDLAHIKGFCVTIEQILSAYGGVTKEEMLEVKIPILGNVSLRRKVQADENSSVDLSTPTIFRKKVNLK
jgi:hypothetical protein